MNNHPGPYKIILSRLIHLPLRWRPLLLASLFLLAALTSCIHAQNQFVIDARPLAQLSPLLYESSGLYVSGPNEIWTHNDSGHTNQLFMIDTMGHIQRTLTITNASNIDWEDLAVDTYRNVYINDAGNNQNDRTDLRIYIIPDPDQIQGNATQAEIIDFMFEDQTAFPPPETNLNFDIEAMIWRAGYLYLFTKNRSTPQTGFCKLYRLPAVAGLHTAQLMDSIFLGNTNASARVTAADVHPESGELLLLTSERIIGFSAYPDDRFFEGQVNAYYFSSQLGQVEALSFISNRMLYMTEEGSEEDPGFLYKISLPLINSLGKTQADAQFSINPNPSNGLFRIADAATSTTNIQVYSAEGKHIKNLNPDSRTFNLSGNAPGFYFLRYGKNQKHLHKILLIP